MQKNDPAMQECITSCRSCQDECSSMLFNHCLVEGGDHIEQKHVKRACPTRS